jgi:hypothetical protein
MCTNISEEHNTSVFSEKDFHSFYHEAEVITFLWNRNRTQDWTEVLTLATTKITIFWDVMRCSGRLRIS